MRKKFFIIIIFCLLFVLTASSTWAYVMSSTNYQMENDAITFVGGLSTSSNYQMDAAVGEIGSGDSSSTNYDLNVGFEQSSSTSTTTPPYISITVPNTVTLSPTINGAIGGTADGQADVLIETNNSSGYTLQLKGDASPAMVSGVNYFIDYSPSGAVPDYTFSIASNTSAFAFSPAGADIVSRYKDDGATCNQAAGADSSLACWDGLSTSDRTVSQSAAANNPAGVTTSLYFRAEAGAVSQQPAGDYSASIIITASTNL